MIARSLLGLLLVGCYSSHARTSDAGPGDAVACVELGAVRCLIDRACWCYAVDEGARCVTCRESCTADDCECRAIGGGPDDGTCR